MHPQDPRSRSTCAQDPPKPCSRISPSGCTSVSFFISFQKLVNTSVSLNSVSRSSKVIASGTEVIAALALVTEKSCRPLTVTLRPVPSVLTVTISAQEALLKGSGQSGGLDRNLSGTPFALKRNPDAEEEWAELELSLSQTFPAATSLGSCCAPT